MLLPWSRSTTEVPVPSRWVQQLLHPVVNRWVQAVLGPLAGRDGRRNLRVSDSTSDLSSQTSIRSSCKTDYSHPRLLRRSLCIPGAPRANLLGGIGHRHRRIGRWVAQTSRRSDTSWPLSHSNTTRSGKSLATAPATEPVQTRTAARVSETLDRRCNRHCTQQAVSTCSSENG
jgi:hypothetical protein